MVGWGWDGIGLVFLEADDKKVESRS
jgi:hypothetical protein